MSFRVQCPCGRLVRKNRADLRPDDLLVFGDPGEPLVQYVPQQLVDDFDCDEPGPAQAGMAPR